MTGQPRRSNPWRIDDSEFYRLLSREAQLRFLLRFAILAPSGHNTQPWSFRITSGGIDVYADHSRRMPEVDPHERELHMSIGASIMNFRIAAAHFGFHTSVLYPAGREESAPVAHLSIVETCAPDEELIALFPAIRRRHTNRAAFDDQPIDDPALSTLRDLLDRFPETLRMISSHDKRRAAQLVEYASRRQRSSAATRAELASWIRPAGDDGLSSEASGIPSILAAAAPWLARHFDAGIVHGARNRDLVEHSAALIVVASDNDRPSLIRAGEVLERLLLVLTTAGLQCSFLNQPIEIEELRDRVQMLAASPRPPQLLLRIGKARVSALPTHRRPLEDVVSSAP